MKTFFSIQRLIALSPLTLTLSPLRGEGTAMAGFCCSYDLAQSPAQRRSLKPAHLRLLLPLRSLRGRGEGRGEVWVSRCAGPAPFVSLFVAISLMLSSTAHAKLNVVVTTPDLASIARDIGGDNIELATLAKPTEDPHFVDAKPSLIVKLNRADALIEGGAELEIGWLRPLLEGARIRRIASGQTGHIFGSDGIALLEVPATLDSSRGDVHAAGNPHYMTDPANAKMVAEHLANAFCQLDPKSCDVFKTNLKSFEDRLDAKIVEWKKLLAPHKGKEVV